MKEDKDTYGTGSLVEDDPFLWGPWDDDLGGRDPNDPSWDDDGIYRPSFTGGLQEDNSLYDQSEDSSWDEPEEARIREDIDPNMDEDLQKSELIQELECALGSKLPNDIWQLSIPQLRKRLSSIRYNVSTKEDRNRAKQIMNKLKR